MPRNNASAYENVVREGLDGRALEATVLLKAAHKLKACADSWPSAPNGGHQEMLSEALRYNQRLWTVFQTDLSDPAHPLPAGVRRNLLLLTRYIDAATFSLLESMDRKKLESLAGINIHIAEGLRLRPAGETREESETTDAELEALDVAV